MAKRRRANAFSLSFLDIMSCGFGAVVLVYLVLNHQTEVEKERVNETLSSEVDMLEREVTDAQQRLVELLNTIAEITDREAVVTGETDRVVTALERDQEALQALEEDARARQENVEALRADLARLEEQSFRAQGSDDLDDFGDSARAFRGDGRRQYLTGLRVDGQNVLILLDSSASMLDETLVNVIRRRNLGPEQRRRADKWQRAVAATDWLTTQLPLEGQFQLYTFSVDAEPAVPDTRGKWLKVADRALETAVESIRRIAPEGGTSLARTFRSIAEFDPPPDNIFLVTDGLPTQGIDPPRRDFVNGRQRLGHFREALRELPDGVPVNVILLPMEGDPMAAGAFWELAWATQGALLSPSRDWP
jgi:hypothetical protein